MFRTALNCLPVNPGPGEIHHGSAGEAIGKLAEQRQAPIVFCTDPPYFDNIGYADLSDFFYVWLRRVLRDIHPEAFSTILVPKSSELVADPSRHEGDSAAARSFFYNGLQRVFLAMHKVASPEYPTTLFYAFKQTEGNSGSGFVSTGWEGFLQALVDTGWIVTGTWPMRTEHQNRPRGQGANALASSVVLACRKRSDGATTTTRGGFRRLLRKEIPIAMRELQQGNIAPVDVAQAAIGPGMSVFSRHEKVLEADGSSMTVRSALLLINEQLDDYLSEQEGEFGADTRFAITWFETHGFEEGEYGDAETLARARNVSVAGIVEAGIARAGGGKVRLLRRDEFHDDWNPEADQRATIWEATQHLIKQLEGVGEEAAARLLKTLGPMADQARDLAYRLFNSCERKGWAEEARAYNGLVVAWPELAKLAARERPTGGGLFDGLDG